MNETQNGTCVQFGAQGTFLDWKFETISLIGRFADFHKNFVNFQNFQKFNEDRILMETNI